jgi:hypothetical protein
MVKEGEGCNVRVERFGTTQVTNPRVVDNSLDEDLEAMLSGLISLVVLNYAGPGGFGANMGNALPH